MAAQFCLAVLNVMSACQCRCGGPELARDLSNCSVVQVPPPNLSVRPETLSVKVGQQVQLLCSADGAGIAGLQWTSPSGEPLSSHRRWQVNGGSAALVSAQLNDAGLYTCTVTSIGGRVSKTTSITVLPAEQLQVSVSPSAFTVKEGERARLVCRAMHGSQRTTVTWSPIPAGSTFVNRTGEFIVQQANKRQHEARYTCTAYDPLTQQTATAVATLTVVPGASPLTVKVVPGSSTVDAGSAVTMRCIVEGGEPKAVYWASQNNDGRKLQRTTTRFAGDTLNIANVTASEQGRYGCTVLDNEGRRVSAEATLTVRESPIKEIRVIEGTELAFDCEILQGDPLAMRIDWEKVGSVLPPNSQVRGKKLTITAIRLSDEGLYRCTGTDAVQGTSSSQSVRIFVGSVPSTPEVTGLQTASYRPGDTLALRCSSQGRPAPQVVWYGPGNGRDVLSSEQVNTNSFRLTNLRVAQGGIYRCEATNEFGVSSTAVRVVVAGEPPSDVRVVGSGDGSDASIYAVRSDALLRCVATSSQGDSLQYSWSKDGGVLPSKAAADGAVLRISNLQFSDAGSYRCTVTNTYGTGQATGTVTVRGPPVDPPQPNPRVISTRVTTDVRLTCLLPTGAERIDWQRDGNKALPASAEVDQQTGQSLLIRNVQPDDAGVYYCRGSNRLGTGPRADIVVTVTGDAPTGVRIVSNGDGPDRQKFNVGSEIRLRCEASQGQQGGELTYLWSKDGAARLTAKAVVRDNVLSIPDVRPDDAGTYVCTVRNSFGDTRATARAVVQEAPRQPVPEPSTTSSRPGATVQLRCPLPPGARSIEWSRERGLQLPSSAVQSQPTAESLTIREVRPEDSGVYYCRAINDAGPSPWVNINVIVIGEAPAGARVIGNGGGASRDEYTPGVTAELQCQSVGGTPPLSYSWSRAGRPLPSKATERGASLRIPFVELQDEGTYTCTVSNSYGSANGLARVQYAGVPTRPNKTNPEPAPLGGEVRLVCQLPPGADRIEWSRDQNKSLPEGHVLSRPTGETLTFTVSRPEDSGTYYCRAMNRHGPGPWVDISVSVIGGPPTDLRVVGNGDGGQRNIYNLGTDVLLRCQATSPSGSAGMRYEWTRAGASLPATAVASGGSLRIPSVRFVDAGVYYCTAINQYGNVRGSVDVIARGLPEVPGAVTITPDSIEPGVDVRLVCRLPFGAQRIEWRRPNGKPLPSRSELSQPTGETLTLRAVTADDAGVYSCFGINTIGTGPWANISVSILVPPRSPNVQLSPAGGQYEVGQTVQLTCYVQDDYGVSYTWRKNRDVVTPRLAQNVGGSSVFRLTNVQISDAGSYTCTARNPYGETSTSVLVSVVSRPTEIRIINVKPSVVVGVDALEMSCEASGSPPPTLEWYKDGQRVGSGPTFRKSVVTSSDIGTYECRATNALGSGSQTTTITIECTPPSLPVVSGRRDSDDYPVGASLVLTCSSSGSPSPRLSWLRESTRVSTTSVLGLTSLSRADSAVFTCAAENSCGRREVRVPVNVFAVRPKLVITGSPSDGLYPVGTTWTLVCIGEGSPPPQVAWRKENTTLGQATAARATLVLNNISPEDRGHYTCEGRNVEGKDEKSVYIDVAGDSPRRVSITGASPDERYTVGSDLILRCDGDGNPRPNVVWTIPGGREVRGDTLRLTNLQVNSTGTYVCSVSNAFGMAKAQTYVFVVGVPPRPPIIPGPGVIEVSVGQDVPLACIVASDESTTEAWWERKSGLPIPANAVRSRDGTLTLKNIQWADADDYVCMARNKYGPSEPTGVTVVIKRATVQASVNVEKGDLVVEGGIYRQGSELIVLCSASGVPAPRVMWELEGGRLPASAEISRGRLTFRSLQPSDAGTYVCKAENDKEVKVVPFTLFIQADVCPQSVTVRSDTMEGYLQVGRPLTLTCEAAGTPQPTFRWMRADGRSLPSNTGRRLYIQQTTRDDATEFVCIAQNTCGSDRASIVLQAAELPTFIAVEPRADEEHVYRRGEDVRLVCRASGRPQPTVAFVRAGGLPLPSQARIVGGDTLLIPNVQPEDAGRYTCVVTNAFGRQEVTWRTVVRSIVQPVIRDIRTDRQPPYFVGQFVHLVCVAENATANEVRYSWVREDGGFVAASYVGARNGSLIFNDIKESDRGTYVCVAENAVGRTTGNVVLIIEGSPYIHLCDSREAPSGCVRAQRYQQEMEIECKTYGKPPITVTWTFEGKSILPENSRIQGSSLLLRQTSSKHNGDYQCRAQNDEGEAVAFYHVIIYSLPMKFIQTPHPAFVEYDYEDVDSKDHSIIVAAMPRQDNGVLLYLDSEDFSEFMSLTLNGGYPELRYGGETVTTVRGTRKLERNKASIINVELKGSRATLTYNDETATGNMPAIHGLFFNKLYLGGLKLDDAQGAQRASWTGSRQGFQGVVTMLIINGRHTDIHDDALEIKGSTDHFDSCTELPLSTGIAHMCNVGRCVPGHVPIGYFCLCRDGSVGENCTDDDRSTGFSNRLTEEAVTRIYAGASSRGGASGSSGSSSGGGRVVVPWYSGADPWGNTLEVPSSAPRRQPGSAGGVRSDSYFETPDTWTSVMQRLPSLSQSGRGGRSSSGTEVAGGGGSGGSSISRSGLVSRDGLGSRAGWSEGGRVSSAGDGKLTQQWPDWSGDASGGGGGRSGSSAIENGRHSVGYGGGTSRADADSRSGGFSSSSNSEGGGSGGIGVGGSISSGGSDWSRGDHWNSDSASGVGDSTGSGGRSSGRGNSGGGSSGGGSSGGGSSGSGGSGSGSSGSGSSGSSGGGSSGGGRSSGRGNSGGGSSGGGSGSSGGGSSGSGRDNVGGGNVGGSSASAGDQWFRNADGRLVDASAVGSDSRELAQGSPTGGGRTVAVAREVEVDGMSLDGLVVSGDGAGGPVIMQPHRSGPREGQATSVGIDKNADDGSHWAVLPSRSIVAQSGQQLIRGQASTTRRPSVGTSPTTATNSVSFKGDGFLEMPSSIAATWVTQSEASFGVRTTEPTGLIFLYGPGRAETPESAEFIALSLVDGRPWFSYKLDKRHRPTVIRSDVRVDDGSEHTIAISRVRGNGTLTVDSVHSYRGTAQSAFFNPSGDVYLGGVPSSSMIGTSVAGADRGFSGCISNVRTSSFSASRGSSIDLMGVAKEAHNLSTKC